MSVSAANFSGRGIYALFAMKHKTKRTDKRGTKKTETLKPKHNGDTKRDVEDETRRHTQVRK